MPYAEQSESLPTVSLFLHTFTWGGEQYEIIYIPQLNMFMYEHIHSIRIFFYMERVYKSPTSKIVTLSAPLGRKQSLNLLWCFLGAVHDL